MSTEKTKKVLWNVTLTIGGKHWPVAIETNLPATDEAFRQAAGQVSVWLLSNNFYPYFGRPPEPKTSYPTGEVPMKILKAERPPAEPPTCPACEKPMLVSKHQMSSTEVSYYCGQRTDNNNYCLWRGAIKAANNETVTWQIEQKAIGGEK